MPQNSSKKILHRGSIKRTHSQQGKDQQTAKTAKMGKTTKQYASVGKPTAKAPYRHGHANSKMHVTAKDAAKLSEFKQLMQVYRHATMKRREFATARYRASICQALAASPGCPLQIKERPEDPDVKQSWLDIMGDLKDSECAEKGVNATTRLVKNFRDDLVRKVVFKKFGEEFVGACFEKPEEPEIGKAPKPAAASAGGAEEGEEVGEEEGEEAGAEGPLAMDEESVELAIEEYDLDLGEVGGDEEDLDEENDEGAEDYGDANGSGDDEDA